MFNRFLLFALTDKYAGIDLFSQDGKSSSWYRIVFHIAINTYNLELIGIVLVQVGNGYSHYSVIVAGNICRLIYVDCIVVVVVGIIPLAYTSCEG